MNSIANQTAATMSASLYFSEGSSNKEYHADVVGVDGGYLVNYRYGRRGSSLTSSTKTTSPVSLEEAAKVFNKLVKEKMSKGYTPGESGTAYQATPDQDRVSGLLPQLLNPVTEDEAKRLIKDDAYFMQEKKDGKRIMIRVAGAVVTANNRKGLVVAIPQKLSDELSMIGDCVLDGELIGEVFHVFDCLEVNGTDIRNETAVVRYEQAFFCIERLVASNVPCIGYVEGFMHAEGKLALFNKVKAAKGEGVVFKLKTSPYTVGRPNSGGAQLKHKFTESASCIVQSVHSTKRSVGLAVLDGGNEVFVGNSTIPQNYSIPAVGEIVEVEYLYAFKGGSLFQPVYRGVRDDIDREACVISQLKFKPDGEDE